MSHFNYRQLPEQIFSTILICPDNTTNQKQLIRNESVSVQDVRSAILAANNLNNVKISDSTFILLDTYDYAFLRQGLIIKFFIAYNNALPLIKIFKYNLNNIYLPPIEVDSIIIDQILDHYEYDQFLNSLKDHQVDPLDELVMSVPKILQDWGVQALQLAKYIKLDKYNLTTDQFRILAPNFPLYTDQDALGNLEYMLVSHNLTTTDYATNVDQGLVQALNETFIKELQPQDLLSIRNPSGCYLFENVYPEEREFYDEAKKRFINNYYPLRQILSRTNFQELYETSPLVQDKYLQKAHVVRHSLDVSRTEYLELLYIASPNDLDKYGFGEYNGQVLFNLAYKGLEKIYNTFSNDYFNYIRFNLSNHHKYASFKSPEAILAKGKDKAESQSSTTNEEKPLKLSLESSLSPKLDSSLSPRIKNSTTANQTETKPKITKEELTDYLKEVFDDAEHIEVVDSEEGLHRLADFLTDAKLVESDEEENLDNTLDDDLEDLKELTNNLENSQNQANSTEDKNNISNNATISNSDSTIDVNASLSNVTTTPKSVHPLDQINSTNYKFSVVNFNNPNQQSKLTNTGANFDKQNSDNLIKLNSNYHKLISNIKLKDSPNSSKSPEQKATTDKAEEKLPPISRITPNNPKIIIPETVRWNNKNYDFIEGIDYIKWDSPIHRPPVFIYNTLKVIPYNYSLTLSFVNFTSICSFPFRFSIEQDHLILLNYLNLFCPQQYYPYGLIDKIDSQQNQFIQQDLKENILHAIDLLYAQFLILFYAPQAYNSKHLSDLQTLMNVIVRICDQLFSNNPSLELHVKYVPMRETLFLQLEAINALADGRAEQKVITKKLRHLFCMQTFTMFVVFLRLLYVSSFEHNDKHADHKEFLKHFNYKE